MRLATPPGTADRSQKSQTVLAARASYVLRSNDVGHMTTAAPRLYPHMWSWDACFIAIGLASVSVSRAIVELDTLLRAQWRNGMLPHIVFAAQAHSYFPDADRWDCARAAPGIAPSDPQTSGICQPPVHAIAVDRIMAAADEGSRAEQEQAADFLQRAWPRLLAWHRWLATARDPDRVGRVTIYHGWESGMDNSPRWDAPYSRVDVGDLPAYTRLDRQYVAASEERPTDQEYDRYLWLVEQLRRAGYDDSRVAGMVDFAVEDVLFSAVLAVACAVMADLGARHDCDEREVVEMADLADRFRAGVLGAVDPTTGLARDRDRRTGEWLSSQTVAGFAPLLCGAGSPLEERLMSMWLSEQWCGHPGFVGALPPSTSPASPAFSPRAYWRGPQWPVLAWMFGWAFRRHGKPAEARRLREEGLRLLSGGEFGEYYEPFTGGPLGSSHQSWTAAVALDWLSQG
jgi:hypothetical protein